MQVTTTTTTTVITDTISDTDTTTTDTTITVSGAASWIHFDTDGVRAMDIDSLQLLCSLVNGTDPLQEDVEFLIELYSKRTDTCRWPLLARRWRAIYAERC